MTELEVTMVSHACLKIRGQFGGLVCDPWILNEPIFDYTTWKYPMAVLSPQEVMDGMDYLFITHGHEDHFHIPSLDYFPRDFKIILPEYTHHPGLRAQTIERTLKAMGFHNIRKINPWQTILLGGNTPFTFIPTAETRSHDWENAGFVIDHPGCKLINMNDNVFDKQLADDIFERFGTFDIGFIQSVGVSMYPGCFKMSREEMKTEANKRHVSFENQGFMVDPLRVKNLVPHAGDFCWLDDKYIDYNWANRSTACLFDKMLQENHPQGDTKCLIMYPGDTWTPTGGLTRNHYEIDWDHYLEDINQIKKKFQGKIDAINHWLKSSDLNQLESRTKVFLATTQKWLCQDYVNFTACIQVTIEGDKADFSFYIDASPQKGFQIHTTGEFTPDQTLFIPQEVWASILMGKATWGMVQWSCKHSQHSPYRLDIGRLYFWMEYYIDLMNRPPQVMIESQQYPDMKEEEKVLPQKGVFPKEEHTSEQVLKPFVVPKREKNDSSCSRTA